MQGTARALPMSRDEKRNPFCLGAPLARVEAQIAFATLLRRPPGLRLETDALEWEPSLSFRGLTRLPVAFA